MVCLEFDRVVSQLIKSCGLRWFFPKKSGRTTKTYGPENRIFPMKIAITWGMIFPLFQTRENITLLVIPSGYVRIAIEKSHRSS